MVPQEGFPMNIPMNILYINLAVNIITIAAILIQAFVVNRNRHKHRVGDPEELK